MSLIRSILIALFLTNGVSLADVTSWQEIPEGRARLLTTGFADRDATGLGVEIDLNPGWKIYWQYAGPVGLPSRFTFQAMATGNVFYPWPERAELQGFASYGYSGRVLFPGIAYAPGPLQVDLAICSARQCIPFRQQFEVPNGSGEDPLVQRELIKALENVPKPHANYHFGQAPIKVFQGPDHHVTLTGTLNNPKDFLMDAGDGAARQGFFIHQARESEFGLTAPYDLKDGANIGDILDQGTVYFRDDDGLWVLTGLPPDADPFSRPSRPLPIAYGLRDLEVALGLIDQRPGDSPISLIDKSTERQRLGQAARFLQSALLLFIGGLLLNIMPCVFPILFLKLKTALSGQANLRASFAWTAGGMVGTFALLGATLALIQMLTGAQLTLGAWMQFPLTTLILAALLILFIANALGRFEFAVPSQIAGAGQGQAGALGDVLAGMVAALMGGACAGALLAFALAYAFAAGGLSLVALMTIMGLGLALPYVLVALVPGLASWMPKPGPWLGWVKPMMAAGLGLTFAYLVFIASRQIALPALFAMMALGAGALALFWAGRARWAAMSLTLMALALPWWSLPQDADERARDYGAEIAARVDAGQTILVDVTAYWCATCQTNKLLVLNTDTVQDMLAAAGASVFTINADIYHPNVNEYLSQVGRNSLPLNIVYSPENPEGAILPTVLTPAAIRAALHTSNDRSID